MTDAIASRARVEVALIQRRTQTMAEVHSAKQLQLRLSLRTRILEKAHDALDRMDAIHVEFMGKDADQVEYPTAPANAFRGYASAMAELLKEYRMEVGEASVRKDGQIEVKDAIRDDHERDALRDAIERELAERGEPVKPTS